MRENLMAVMRREGITIQDVADFLGVHRNTASTKVNGETDFSIQEALDLHKRFFTPYSVEWLYRNPKTNKESEETP